MKLLMIGVVALVLGVLGGAYTGGKKAGATLLAAQAEADSVAALAAEGHDEGDGAAEADGHEDDLDATSHPTEVAAAVPNATPDARPAANLAPMPIGAPGSTTPVRDAAPPRARPNSESSKRLAKIFGAMKAEDAAEVLQEMDNLEVESVLLNLSERQAAQILGAFDRDRAAALTRSVLIGRPAAAGGQR